jgi:protein-disulfide isomerase
MTRKQLPFFLAFLVLLFGALACACLGSGNSLSGLAATAQAAATRAQATTPPTQSSADATALASDRPVGDGKAMGPANARVVVAEYGDFQCPICKEFYKTSEAQLVAQYVKTGKVRFEYHHFIVIDLNTGGHESERAAEASECASGQGKFWAYHNTLFDHQAGEGSGAFSDDKLLGFAQSLGLDMTAFQACFASSTPGAAVQADVARGNALSVEGTPTVFINGVQVPNPFDYSAFKAQLDQALAP